MFLSASRGQKEKRAELKVETQLAVFNLFLHGIIFKKGASICCFHMLFIFILEVLEGFYKRKRSLWSH